MEADGLNKNIFTYVDTFRYPGMSIKEGDFTLRVLEGEYRSSEIIVLRGESGTGKSTYINMLAYMLRPDTIDDPAWNRSSLGDYSLKPQDVSYIRKFPLTVRRFLDVYGSLDSKTPWFISNVMNPLQMEPLMDKRAAHLSDNELQRVALVRCLTKMAHLYLIDEPFTYLDPDQRVVVAQVIKNSMLREGTTRTGFVVEQDLEMTNYLADCVMVFEGIPSLDCTANSPIPWN